MSKIITEKADSEICKENQNQSEVSVPFESSELINADSLVEASHPDWDVARQEDRMRAWAKYEILMAFIKYRMEFKAKGIRYSDSGQSFVKKLNNGEICMDAMNKLKVKQIALPTLIRWEGVLRASGDMDIPVSLLEDFRHCGRKSKIDAELRNWIRELAVDERNLNPNWIYLYLADQLSMNDKVLPISQRRLQFIIREIRKDIYAMSLGKGKERVRNKVKLHNVRINDLLPGELFESDGHITNILVKSPFYCHRNPSKRYLVRPVLIVWMDVATGLIVGHRVCLTENKGAVKNSLHDAIARFGTPKAIRMDNGGAYRNIDYAPCEFYKEAQGKKKLTTDEKIAKRMIHNGDKGLYLNLGIEYHFTIPGNPESKGIEGFWDYCISPFEKSFPSWIGNKIENRPEIFKNYDSKTLARKFGDKFPTWDEFCEKLDKYISYYNHKQRASLVTIDDEQLSPIEAYNQVEHHIPDKLRLQNLIRDPYIEMKMVQRSVIEKNGILYWHPLFASLIGKKVGIFYDEKNLKKITICNDRGQIHPEKAIAINPGLQSGDDLTAMIENNRRVKIGKLCYLALTDVTGAMKIEKMLSIASKELLPLSNTKQLEYEEVKYLSFDEALDSIAGEDNDEIDDDQPYDAENQELIDELKKDIDGMFGN
jgi:transposase InsO family protein